MRSRLVTAVVAALLHAAPLQAQHGSATIPPELEGTWARFADAWNVGDLERLAPQLTSDFTLVSPAGSFLGRTAPQDEWARTRAGIGPRYQPGSFVVNAERILETGRAHLVFAAAAEGTAGEEMCDPDDGYHRQPTRYLREWVFSTDGTWQVKSLVLH